jgi:hypothetical protein
MNRFNDDTPARGRRAGIVLAAALLCGCGAGARPLRLPPGHPADPGTPGTPRAADPAPAAPQPEPAPAAKVYTCPMHPEVTSNEPGRCPKCGMRLQEVKPAGKEEGK